MSEAVIDAGPLIHLTELNALDVLKDFSRLSVPNAVWQEVQRHRPEALSRPDLAFERTEAPPLPENLQVLVRAFSLDQGETQALSLLSARPQAIFLCDDAAARLAAQELGFQVHGTVGLLIRSARAGLRTREDVMALLRSLPEMSTLHIRSALLQEILERLAEEWR
jgi:predicted nucleic acid-binding protein